MRFRGTVYRAHNPEWAWTPLSGEGARRYGGRFNRRGKAALYCSLSQITAIREATPLGRPMQPLTLCAYEVDAEPIFDAADPMQLRRHEVAEAELACPTWEADMLERGVAASQHLAERLVAASYVGMLVRSFAIGASREDLNLVMWQWGDAHPIRVTLIDVNYFRTGHWTHLIAFQRTIRFEFLQNSQQVSCRFRLSAHRQCHHLHLHNQSRHLHHHLTPMAFGFAHWNRRFGVRAHTLAL